MLARGEAGSQEVTTFFRKELRRALTLVRWQRRTLRHLHNQCGHRLCEEGAVCQAREEDLARDQESCEEELVSPADDVTKVMTLASGHPVTSELCHRLGLGGINTGTASQGDTSVRALTPHTPLSRQTSQQQQPLPQSNSPPLPLFEQEAIRTRGRPWSGPPAKRLSQDAWYTVWQLVQHMGKRKNKVVRRLEF